MGVCFGVRFLHELFPTYSTDNVFVVIMFVYRTYINGILFAYRWNVYGIIVSYRRLYY